MRSYIEHSAKGTTWTSKNHKYIRKEGNRYIYPEDLKQMTATYTQNSPDYKQMSTAHRQAVNRANAANGGYNGISQRTMSSHPNKQSFGTQRAEAEKRYQNERNTAQELKRSNAGYNQNSADYKSLSQQQAHRSKALSAANNQNSADYKALSNANRQKMNREKAANGSYTDYKKASWEHSVNDPERQNRLATKYRQSENRKEAANGNPVDYKQLSKEHRENDPNLGKQLSNHYRDVKNRKNRQAENRAKATNVSSPDYKAISQEHRDNDYDTQQRIKRKEYQDRMDKAKQRVATWDQNSPDYKHMSELHSLGDVEKQERVAKKKKQARKTKLRAEFGREVVKDLFKKSLLLSTGGVSSNPWIKNKIKDLK